MSDYKLNQKLLAVANCVESVCIFSYNVDYFADKGRISSDDFSLLLKYFTNAYLNLHNLYGKEVNHLIFYSRISYNLSEHVRSLGKIISSCKELLSFDYDDMTISGYGPAWSRWLEHIGDVCWNDLHCWEAKPFPFNTKDAENYGLTIEFKPTSSIDE